MGLAWFIVYWKWRALRSGDERYNVAVRFWAKIFGLNFAVGVVTGIPMEVPIRHELGGVFQVFGWSHRADARHGRNVRILFGRGDFVGALVFGEKRLGPGNHFLAALGVAIGSWLSAYFILVTNAFMQHPIGYAVTADDGRVVDMERICSTRGRWFSSLTIKPPLSLPARL